MEKSFVLRCHCIPSRPFFNSYCNWIDDNFNKKLCRAELLKKRIHIYFIVIIIIISSKLSGSVFNFILFKQNYNIACNFFPSCLWFFIDLLFFQRPLSLWRTTITHNDNIVLYFLRRASRASNENVPPTELSLLCIQGRRQSTLNLPAAIRYAN